VLVLLVLGGILGGVVGESWGAVMFGLLVAMLIVGLGVMNAKNAEGELARLKPAFIELVESLRRKLSKSFVVVPCSRCGEFDFEVMDMTPNARSIKVRCITCLKISHFRAVMEDNAKVRRLYDRYFQEAQSVIALARNVNHQIDVALSLSAAPQPGVSRTKRPMIPLEMRRAVWQRDGGKCVECGSDFELQFDHIIPVSKGGATTIANLQILCGPCNRKKNANI
jgi:5-methylcytosine-specific restriction endonuclease McrA